MAIIQSLLDTDFYKLTMAQAAFNQFATTEVVYEFKCRNEARWTEEILQGHS
jgi:nicotinate phosphoribosyltransferase